MRYHFTPIRMTSFKKTRGNKCWQGCGEEKTLVHFRGNVNWSRKCKLWKTVWKVIKKIKNSYHMIQQFYFWVFI